jgi:hypothetical protein
MRLVGIEVAEIAASAESSAAASSTETASTSTPAKTTTATSGTTSKSSASGPTLATGPSLTAWSPAAIIGSELVAEVDSGEGIGRAGLAGYGY